MPSLKELNQGQNQWKKQLKISHFCVRNLDTGHFDNRGQCSHHTARVDFHLKNQQNQEPPRKVCSARVCRSLRKFCSKQIAFSSLEALKILLVF